MASIAEMERNTLSENVKLGMTQRAKEGNWNGGVVFGYDSVEKELSVNPKEAETVHLIFKLYAEGKGLKAIANHLNKAGFRTKRGKHFSINGIATILDNPIYNGKIRWLQVENWDKKRRRGKNPILHYRQWKNIRRLSLMSFGILFSFEDKTSLLSSVNPMSLSF